MLDLAEAVAHELPIVEAVLDRYQIIDSGDTPLRWPRSRTRCSKLQAIGRDHVWAYYLRNMVRPAVISEERVDAIVGNPPWLTYSRSADIVREELVKPQQKHVRNLGRR